MRRSRRRTGAGRPEPVRRVTARESFRADVAAQIAFLLAKEEGERIANLAAEIEAAGRILGTFPELGREIGREGGTSVRALHLRRVPFVITYALAPERPPSVTLLRIFHARQRRPLPERPALRR